MSTSPFSIASLLNDDTSHDNTTQDVVNTPPFNTNSRNKTNKPLNTITKNTQKTKDRSRYKVVIQRFPANQTIHSLKLEERRRARIQEFKEANKGTEEEQTKNEFASESLQSSENNDNAILSYDPSLPLATKNNNNHHDQHQTNIMTEDEMDDLAKILLKDPDDQNTEIQWSKKNENGLKYTAVISEEPKQEILKDVFNPPNVVETSKTTVATLHNMDNSRGGSPRHMTTRIAKILRIRAEIRKREEKRKRAKYSKAKIRTCDTQKNTNVTKFEKTPLLLQKLKEHVEYTTQKDIKSCTLVYFPTGESCSLFKKITPQVVSVIERVEQGVKGKKKRDEMESEKMLQIQNIVGVEKGEERTESNTFIIQLGEQREIHIRKHDDNTNITGLLPHERSLIHFQDAPKQVDTGAGLAVYTSTKWEIAYPKKNRIKSPTVVIAFHTHPILMNSTTSTHSTFHREK